MQPDSLILQMQRRDEKAFERLYELYSESTFGIIYNVVQDTAIAEEVLQDVFIKIWDNANSYSSTKGRFFTWVLNIARNAAIDKIRSKDFKNKKKNLKAEFFVNILEDQNSFSKRTDTIGIRKFVNALEPLCKKVIEILYFKGFTQKDAAVELDMPLGTVKTRNRICINRLRELMTE
ncbi:MULTISPECIES: RNA polymerase sigma factor [Croceibacter]|jgi:RNA polymerase sigma-70 factor (ECF subfamily)|uniref:Putative RNA polymerase sigma factor n=1 Tax=Croceibacter atlanticus (strain ATCC BAA-628 / JCM 21780 / CIP 108009 / IAM 15332 / KCTC 12090 / HTCC2559) TaxID=216432 RepID=A3UAG4_CROAH|nr:MULTISPECIES: sigma-70 family RNA polymerase sigma factor [Croceibacter]EAP86800.1 putative RNA polymerase sigma factor [Croceibacter atlanticus HTCC2559]MAM22914.1 RNA polymerase subunit sigma-70 [Croceibacter sp.]MBG25032.1 RNA polymerase subunit sigma-70 [Croceibacter sp.]MBW4970696.1 sigma-70 family RNA polymerase sigma factor [Croceibacter atlanticus]WSP34369.1 sigma-70 family RNA polymerase sigma factor [Croceibacter atlanticus]|tara:strand:- start:1893 stop:2423 length:531 start_codon:yes stop_codon:yes gene_type:complete